MYVSVWCVCIRKWSVTPYNNRYIFTSSWLTDQSSFLISIRCKDSGSQLSFPPPIFSLVLWLWMCPYVNLCVIMFVVVSVAIWRHSASTGGCCSSVYTGITDQSHNFFINSLKDDQNCDGALSYWGGSKPTLERMGGGLCACFISVIVFA